MNEVHKNILKNSIRVSWAHLMLRSHFLILNTEHH